MVLRAELANSQAGNVAFYIINFRITEIIVCQFFTSVMENIFQTLGIIKWWTLKKNASELFESKMIYPNVKAYHGH